MKNQDLSRPMFIIGNPRSGTSMFRMMVSNHQNLIVPPECGFLQWWYPKYESWTIDDSSNQVKADEFIADLRTSKKIKTWKLDYEKLSQRIVETSPSNYAELASQVYLQYAEGRGQTDIVRWGDKNNYYINHLELLVSIYPNAQFLFITRDGRDVACSYKALKDLKTESQFKPELPTKVDEIAKEWVSNNQRILDFSKGLSKENYHFLRYEDLVENPEIELRKVTDFLGLEYSPNMLNYHKENRQNQVEPLETMDWKKKTLEKPDPSEIGKYKDVLSEGEIDTFEDIAEKLLSKFKYD